MKKLLSNLFLGVLCGLSSSIYCCTITFINDTNSPVHVILDDGTDIRVAAQQETTFGQSDALAAFTVLKQVGSKLSKYRLTQLSCSPTHQIDVYALAIGKEEIEYFEVSKNLNATAAGGCGCGHKDRPRN